MKIKTLSPIDRARLYVANIPSAVAGQHGHDQTFSVAVALMHGFNLSESEAWPILLDYGARCQPPWSIAELRHKLTSAGKLDRHSKTKGHLRGWSPAPPAPRPPRPEPRIIGKVTLLPEFLQEQSTPLKPPPPPPAPTDPAEVEARRIANELLKAYHAGFITGADDPFAAQLAKAIRIFDGTIVPPTAL